MELFVFGGLALIIFARHKGWLNASPFALVIMGVWGVALSATKIGEPVLHAVQEWAHMIPWSL
ncbi:hypothetical protein [Wenjunlia tyrosinilytica]|uniref:Uncharacterized protein n=1 Tax=Wenjunlia tyrosinilytica TaxID=1544741 RepID=A0A917ZY55_9ACTN|nr:hypothetical protein [Wenjunlia tyrosinilytica]GGO98153.1 hypothetical protein GCM10012280_61620 [Wenjunlia tyrosinilytica]